MLEKLWNDIRLIYDGLNFSCSLLIDDLMIMSQDNHYLLYHKHDDITTRIRIEIEKHYNLVSMWSDDKELDITNYKLYVEVDSKIELDENHKIELTYNIITPFLRECKLSEIL